ncbi:unnamed protein product [Linum trigynum]|uniref:Uncharacterized protein n=1 Tax=Linum trigynum TaxID=586398 RepID=A0AAV2G901_9ROSI
MEVGELGGRWVPGWSRGSLAILKPKMESLEGDSPPLEPWRMELQAWRTEVGDGERLCCRVVEIKNESDWGFLPGIDAVF